MVVVKNFMIQKILQPHGISTNLEDYFFSALFFKSWFGAAHRVVGHKLSIISLHVTIFRRSSSVVQYSLWFILELVKERVVKCRSYFLPNLICINTFYKLEINKNIFGPVIFLGN